MPNITPEQYKQIVATNTASGKSTPTIDVLNGIGVPATPTPTEPLIRNETPYNMFNPETGEPIATPTATPTPTAYKIQSGDTLGALAQKNNTTIAELMAANPQITNANIIIAGQNLNIPGAGTTTKPSIIPTATSPVTSTEEKNAQIQAQKDAEAKTKADALKTQQEELVNKTTEAQTATAQSVIDKLKTEAGPAPDPYSREETLKALQSSEGTTAIQTQINAVNTELSNAKANKKADMYKVGDELESMEFVTSKQEKIGRLWDEKIAALENNKKNLTDEYNLKVSNINAIMEAKSQDYTTAKAAYDDKFSQAIQMMQLTNTMENTATDNARANLTATMNMLQNVDPSLITPEMRANLSTMEAQAGYTPGISQFVLDNATDEILSNGQVENADGTKSLYVMYKGKDGVPYTKIVGTVGTGNGVSATGSYEDIAQEAINADATPQQALNEAIDMAYQRGITLTKKEQDKLYANILNMKKVVVEAPKTTTAATTSPTNSALDNRIAELRKVLGGLATSTYLISQLTKEGYSRNEVVSKVGNIVDKAQNTGSNLLNVFSSLFK